MRYPGFVYGSAQSQSLIASGERTVNFYIEKLTSPAAANPVALYPTPGQQAAFTVPDIGTRGAFAMNTRAFAVIGAGLYEFYADNTVTKRGTVAQDSNPATMTYNGPAGGQVFITSGSHGYCYVLATNVLTQVLTGTATMGGMLDGYFLAFDQTLSKVRLSALNDGTTWDPTQFALRSSQPDPWQAMIINAPDIWFLGEQTSDVWYDAGTSPFPLAARTGLTIPFGVASPFSVAVTGGSLLWLARNKDGAGMVVQTRGYSPLTISTPEVETALAGYQRTSVLTDAEAMVYQSEGHTFYLLKFPSANATWAYDLTTQSWAERGTWNPANTRYDAWRPRIHVYAFGKHLVGESATGTMSQLDVTFGSEADGSAIRRLRRAPVLVNENRRLSIRRFELSLEAGLGLATGQGSTPQVMFRASADGGKTWGNERQASAGQIGQYNRRVFWTRCGSPRLWVPEVTVSDPVPWRICDAYLNNDGAAQEQAA